MSVSLHTQTVLHCLIIQVLNIKSLLPNIWYTSFTSAHSNLEHGLAILTESFSPYSDLFYTTSLVEVQSRSDVAKPYYSWYCLFVMHMALDQTCLYWFNLAPTNLNCRCKACYTPSGKFHCCLVMLLIDKLDADAMHQMPMMESSIVTAKIPFVLWTYTNVILSH